MRSISRTCLTVALGLAWLTGAAQSPNSDEQDTYIYATYYVCDLNQQEEADRITAGDMAPIYDRAMDEGLIAGWGWLAHQTGGRWRRLSYFSAGSIDELIAAQARISEQEDPRAAERFNAACGAHDDYIWRNVARGGSESEDGRGAVSLSTYYVCDIAREDRADEIFEAALTPIYDQLVRDGLIRSWNWHEHVVGGEYRRLANMAADNWSQIFRAIDAYVAASSASELGREMYEICNSHADYMWDIDLERN
jgi:hypothetical protein